MTPEVTMTFVVGLTQFMTPRGHGLTKGQLDLQKKDKKKIEKKMKKKFKKNKKKK